MSDPIIHHERGNSRSLDTNAERAYMAAPSTQSAPEVAAPPPVPADLGLRPTLDLVAPGGTVTIVLDAELVRLLVLALLLSILRLLTLRTLARLVAEMDALAKGRLSGDVLTVVRSLVRTALVECPELPADRRDHAAGLLAASPGNVGGDGAIRLTGCAITADGYDVAMVTADGEARVAAITLPPHLVDEVTNAVLLSAAKVVTAPTLLEAQGIIRRLADGRLEPELFDAIAFAICAALAVAPELTKEQKDTFLGLDSVQKLTERYAAA